MTDTGKNKIDVAVRFLQNPNVRPTSKDRKVEFLKSKGLTDAEIEEAFDRTSTNVDEHVVALDSSSQRHDAWSWLDYIKAFVASAGLVAAANYAYKAYLLPYVAHEMKDDRRIEDLLESVQAMKDDLKQSTYELTGTLKQLQTVLDEQQKLLHSVNVAIGSKTHDVDVSGLADIKGELSSLRNMLLGRRSFPSSPFSGPPSIPAWQKVQSSKSDVVLVQSKSLDFAENSHCPHVVEENTMVPILPNDAVTADKACSLSENVLPDADFAKHDTKNGLCAEVENVS